MVVVIRVSSLNQTCRDMYVLLRRTELSTSMDTQTRAQMAEKVASQPSGMISQRLEGG